MALSTPPENQVPGAHISLPTLVGSGAVAIRPKFKIDLATEYGIHRNTICEMCAHIGITGKKKLSIREVVAFYTHYGYPGDYQIHLHVPNG